MAPKVTISIGWIIQVPWCFIIFRTRNRRRWWGSRKRRIHIPPLKWWWCSGVGIFSLLCCGKEPHEHRLSLAMRRRRRKAVHHHYLKEYLYGNVSEATVCFCIEFPSCGISSLYRIRCFLGNPRERPDIKVKVSIWVNVPTYLCLFYFNSPLLTFVCICLDVSS